MESPSHPTSWVTRCARSTTPRRRATWIAPARSHERLAPVYEAMAITSNPIPVKTALEMMGVVSARMRLPMVDADEEQRAAIRSALESHGLLTPA